MEDYYYKRSYVPAFGSWDWNNDLPFTQCFESARQPQAQAQAQFGYSEDRDLYVAGDLYQNDVVESAVIVVPRRSAKVRHVKEEKASNWVVKEGEAPPSPTAIIMNRPTPKPVDEDLYTTSPDMKSREKRGLGFLSSCLMPTCAT
ncbi:hypothetical protein HS088_TW10G00308 [Tripterygium wilfordii]|uniref:RPM1-interacting protein 4-like n=1 Tax=Tripterygium wilfordii TaxID=458696 RepID=A0A7J7D4P9_TRIWF|nr:uncharacterized protein LOC120007963 [Tripterygium wilfordii]KAF5741312.1 hypothetical protein HS088_TW10G00308 [Tripterygium wilfordii]